MGDVEGEDLVLKVDLIVYFINVLIQVSKEAQSSKMKYCASLDFVYFIHRKGERMW